MIGATDNLSVEEKACAGELLDIYLNDTAQSDYNFIAAVDLGGRPMGYVCYGPTPLTQGTYDLYWIIVASSARGKGVGGALIGRTEEIVRGRGCRLLVANTSGRDDYRAARAFYAKAGFTEEARIRGFYGQEDDLVVFVKRY
ncbi:MAG: GNAT family N-acetyltransferase [Deltaproteobacteria bacterium]|nr:GNAT family N-acetyltransferase [Deltaproteobacteria bacterium]